MAENVPNVAKKHKPRDSRGSANPKQEEPKEFTKKYITVRPMKAKDKEAALESAREVTLYLQGTNVE